MLFLLVCLVLALAGAVPETRNAVAQQDESPTTHLRGQQGRRLSSSTDMLMGDVIRTFNGQVPRVGCEAGFYRPSGGNNLQMTTGQRLDGCYACPRGTYGSQTGMTDRSCSGSCPVGRYSNLVGRTSIDDCIPCPLGRYGSGTGLTSSQCSGGCPAGKFTPTTGTKDVSQCQDCILGENIEPCKLTVKPRFDRRTKALNT